MKTYLMLTNKHYNNEPIKGGNRTFIEVVKSILSNGDKIIMISPSYLPIEYSKDISIIKVRKIKEISIYFPVFIRQTFQLLKVVIKKKNVLKLDKIIIVGMSNGLCAIPIKYILKRPLVTILPEDPTQYRGVLRVKGNNNLFSKNSYLSALLSFLYIKIVNKSERFLLACSNTIIVQSNKYRSMFIKRHKKISDRIFVLPNSVNTSWVSRRWESVNNSDEAVSLTYIGGLEYWKGVSYLLGAFKKLAQNNSKIFLNIIGEGSLAKDLKDEVNNNPIINNRVVFHGWTSPCFDLIAKSDLIVIPSISDSSPRVVGEALYIGTPVIGSYVGGIPEQLEYDDLLFNSASVDAIYDILIKIINDKNMYKKIKTLCNSRKKKLNFNWSEKLLKIIDKKI
jgi:glycosyltransferase involved in cell wall biosynthesis